MPVVAADIMFMKSSVGTSDGGAESASEIVDGVDNNLWPDISDAARSANGDRKKKIFIRNDNGTESLLNPSFWVATPPAGITVTLGYGATSADDDDSGQGNMSAFGANAVAGLISSGADVRTATITGLNGSSVATSETVTLTGTTEVLTTTTWSKVWGVRLSATNGSNTVTITQGSAGTARGTIGPNQICCWLWVAATSKSTGITVPTVVASTSIPIWVRQVWTAGVASARPTSQVMAVEENA